MEAILVGIGGAFGAVLRYGIGQLIGSRQFPWATLVVNAQGSVILGIVIFGVSDSEMLLLVGVGFCGAFTTFSSFSFQTVELWERGDHMLALVNALGNLGMSLLGFACAWFLVEVGLV